MSAHSSGLINNGIDENEECDAIFRAAISGFVRKQPIELCFRLSESQVTRHCGQSAWHVLELTT